VPELTGRLSLYRRWRPQRFSDVVGQDDIVRTLRNAVTAGDVAHAYLFAGERGIGKTSVARILSRAVNCLRPRHGEPCNECANCLTITTGRSLDIVEIDGASNRGIDHIRKLREEVNFAPTDLRVKVYIIDEVHMLTTEAFNALLKTLEEPPAHAMFIFATTEPHKLPRTIVSRCQAFEFRRLSVDAIAAHLRLIARAEDAQLAEEAAMLLARRANGGLRDAVVMLEQAATYGSDSITEGAVLDMLGLAPRETQLGFIAALERGDRAAVLRTIAELSDRGKDLELFLGDVISLLRERIASDAATAERDIALARGLLAVKADLYRALDRQIRMEIGALALAASLVPHVAGGVPPGDANRPQDAPRSGQGGRAKAPASPRTRPAVAVTDAGTPTATPAARNSQTVDVASPRDVPQSAPPALPSELVAPWNALLREVERDRIAVAAYLTEAEPSADGTLLVLSFHPEHTFHKESLEKNENMQYVAGAVRRHFGDAWRFDVLLDQGVVKKALPRELLLEKARLVAQVFDGRIVKEAS
jgi:DNA polymerase-3 subunit gamma/tau